MKTIANGVYPTMITPYTEENEVDYAAVENLVKWYAEKGCDGIFAICQSSEIFYLTLEERVKIAQTVIETARAVNPDMNVVASGHISYTIEEQARELNAIAALKPDALVLISNRLDIANEGDDVWIANAEKLLAKLPEEIPLGIYECPHPYKRLLTPRILEWCKASGRFAFIKDTCCNVTMLTERLEQLDGSGIKLYNANAQTLLHALKHGAAGYSGVMANFHPELYVYLCKHFADEAEKCEGLQEVICMTAFTEALAYPVTAKYHLNEIGVKMALNTRTRKMTDLKEYDRHIIDQMRRLAEKTAKELGI